MNIGNNQQKHTAVRFVLRLILFMFLLATGCASIHEATEIADDVYLHTIEMPHEVLHSFETQIEKLLLQMTVEEKIGQLFICRIPGRTTLNAATLALINDLHIGGFILFSYNISYIEQVQQLTADLQEASKIPLFIAIDEEGGRVSRIQSLFTPRIGSALSIGQNGDTQAAYNAMHTIGERLALLGINMNFAPVADIWYNPSNTVIGNRAYGSEPELVGRMTAAAVHGLRGTGVLAVIKHFPGHGGTREDSHEEMAVYPHNMDRFNTFEAIPFRYGIEAGTDGVMTGHIASPQIHPDTPLLPAVFSAYLMQDVLRNEWKYDGLIITDALDMRGLTRYYSVEEIVVNAFLAGADILLMPADTQKAVYTMREAYYDGRITAERLDASVRRILLAKYRSTD